MSMDAAPQPAQPTLPPRAWLAAAFCTFHLFATLLYVLPYPPYFDAASLAHPEARDELTRLFGLLHSIAPVMKDPKELQDRVLGMVRVYTDTYFKVRKVVEPYIDAAGISQSWNMFGGTPPRYPRVFMVDIQPVGQASFENFQDFHWDTPSTLSTHFRHRKAQEILSLSGWDRQRDDYANWWARRWNAQHPDRPAEKVRLYYWQLTTPPPEAVRAGNSDRHEERVLESIWTPPRDAR